MAIWYALNIKAGGNTVTISGMGSTSAGMTAIEYSGVATTGALGITSTKSDFGGTATTTPTSNSFTPSSGSMVFMAFADDTVPQSSISAGSGYVLIQADGTHIDAEEENRSGSSSAQDRQPHRGHRDQFLDHVRRGVEATVILRRLVYA